MQRFGAICEGRRSKSVRNAVTCMVLLSSLWVAGCGVAAKPLGAGNQSNTSSPNSANANSSAVSSQLVATPSSLNFGGVSVGNAAAQLISLTNTGATSVTIASVSASAGFGATMGSGVTLMPNQSVNIYVSFQPSAAGKATGLATISGTAPQPDQHSVALDWSPSASAVAGYNVYRGSNSGGPYAKVNTAVDPIPDFNDAGVTASSTYYYVVTSIDRDSMESAFSNQVVVSIP
jgi:hypothetical protein